jgi:hypothetical protein
VPISLHGAWVYGVKFPFRKDFFRRWRGVFFGFGVRDFPFTFEFGAKNQRVFWAQFNALSGHRGAF